MILDTCKVDLDRGLIVRDGETSSIGHHERSALLLLVMADGEVVPRSVLEETIWGIHPESDTQAVPTAMRRLRAKLEADTRTPTHLVTVRGVGWRLVAVRFDAFLPPGQSRRALARQAADFSQQHQDLGSLQAIQWLVQHQVTLEQAHAEACMQQDTESLVDLTTALCEVYRRRGPLESGRHCAESALAVVGLRPEQRTMIEVELAEALLISGGLAELTDALSVIGERSDSLGQRSNIVLGLYAISTRDFDEAERRLTLVRTRGLGTELGARALLGLAVVHEKRGELPQAFECLKWCEALYQRLGHGWRVAWVAGTLGRVHYSQGDLEQAAVHFERAANACRDAAWLVGQGYELSRLANVRSEQGRLADADHLFACADLLLRRGATSRQVAFVGINRGILRLQLGQWEPAAALLRDARRRFISFHPVAASLALANQGLACLGMGRSTVAVGMLASALPALAKMPPELFENYRFLHQLAQWQSGSPFDAGDTPTTAIARAVAATIVGESMDPAVASALHADGTPLGRVVRLLLANLTPSARPTALGSTTPGE